MTANTKTESEAREKRCPFYFTRPYHQPGAASSGGSIVLEIPPAPLNDQNCIAAECMMWKWGAGSTTEGYCGLAGKVVIP